MRHAADVTCEQSSRAIAQFAAARFNLCGAEHCPAAPVIRVSPLSPFRRARGFTLQLADRRVLNARCNRVISAYFRNQGFRSTEGSS